MAENRVRNPTPATVATPDQANDVAKIEPRSRGPAPRMRKQSAPLSTAQLETHMIVREK